MDFVVPITSQANNCFVVHHGQYFFLEFKLKELYLNFKNQRFFSILILRKILFYINHCLNKELNKRTFDLVRFKL